MDEGEKKELWAKIKQVAIQEVCPLNLNPSTVYEINMVKSLTAFGYRLIQELNKDNHVKAKGGVG